jgi:hypothetical protein
MSGRLLRRASLFRGCLVIIVVAASAAVVVSPAESKVPPPLVGAWTHYVSAADWARVGVTGAQPYHYSIYIDTSGSVAVGENYLKFTFPSAGRVVISGTPDCHKTKGLYQWHVVGRHLTFTKIHDACAEEVGLFAGVWNRVGT